MRWKHSSGENEVTELEGETELGGANEADVKPGE